MNKVKWTLRYRLWQKLHMIVNNIAWRTVPTAKHDDPRRNHWMWKLNDWIANHYVKWWIEQTTGKKYPE